MINYTNYEVEDFLRDDFFIDWALKNSPEHEVFWQQWLAEHPDRKKVVDRARIIAASIKIEPLQTELTDTEVNAFITHIRQQAFDQANPKIIRHRYYQSNWFRIAALLLLFVSAGLLFIKNKHQERTVLKTTAQADPYLHITNHTTESRLVQMSDGSLAVLKPGSGLKYLRSFHDKREVFLDGEAFFEVHKNPKMPFLVHNHDMVIRVLGTSFTVKSLNNSDIKVVVNTGKVLVYNQKATTKADRERYEVTLVPNEQVTYIEKQLRFKKETLRLPLILSKEIAQKEFTFDNSPLSYIIERIDKAYGVNIEYDKAKLGDINLTASLSDRPLDEKVKLICKAINVSCQFTDGRIIIHNQNLNVTPTN